MDITGKVVEVLPIQQVSDRFRKRELIIEYATNPQYPEFVKFESNNPRRYRIAPGGCIAGTAILNDR